MRVKDVSKDHTQVSYDSIFRGIVRDYECDVQGIVNNAVYMNYCEHARNLCITARGYTLHSLHERGENPVVVKAEMNFKRSLVGGDEFEIRTDIEKKGAMRLLFHQRIYRVQDNEGDTHTLSVHAVYTVAVLNNNYIPIPISRTLFKDT